MPDIKMSAQVSRYGEFERAEAVLFAIVSLAMVSGYRHSSLKVATAQKEMTALFSNTNTLPSFSFCNVREMIKYPNLFVDSSNRSSLISMAKRLLVYKNDKWLFGFIGISSAILSVMFFYKYFLNLK